MFSTLNGAKACAKDLKRLLDDSSLLYPLTKCRAAVAKAGGYRDWHDLESALGAGGRRPIDADAYRRRLLGAVPFPCRAPIQAWLDDEADPEENLTERRYSRHWYRDGWPYERAITSLHFRQSSLLHRGSGRGQKLRSNLVLGLLLNRQGGRRDRPRLDPDTLALVFKGDLATLYRKDFAHSGFEREFARLQEAGILQWSEGVLKVFPPPGSDVIAEVFSERLDLVEHWTQDGLHSQEQVRALRDALAHLGVADATGIAEAIVTQGSSAYITPSGPTLDVLSTLAAEGRPDAISYAFRLFATVHPAAASKVRASVPAKIVSRYFCGALKLDTGAVTRWAEKHPDWPQRLEAALPDPAEFSHRVGWMVQEIAASCGAPRAADGIA